MHLDRSLRPSYWRTRWQVKCHYWGTLGQVARSALECQIRSLFAGFAAEVVAGILLVADTSRQFALDVMNDALRRLTRLERNSAWSAKAGR